MLNALKHVKILEDAGISRVQAEAHVQMMEDMVEDDLATKQELRSAVERLEHKMLEMEYRLTIKLGTIVTVVVGLGIAAVTALGKLH